MGAEKWGKNLDYFSQAIERDVNAKRHHARRQLVGSLDELVSAEVTTAEARAKNRLQEETLQLTRSINREISRAIFAAKSECVNARDRQIAALLEEVAVKLKAFTRSPEYVAYTIKRITEVRPLADFAIVSLAPDDMHMAEKITAATGLLAEEGGDYIGGFVLFTENRMIRADYTFKTRLNEIGHGHDAPWNR